MKKIVKKFAVALIVAMMAVIMLPFSAAADEGKYTLYVKVPNTWGTPNVWAWTDSGVNAFAEWPGEPMEEGEDGWYVMELPVEVTNLVLNYNGDANKTKDIKVTGQDVQITVVTNIEVTIEYLEAGEEDSSESTDGKDESSAAEDDSKDSSEPNTTQPTTEAPQEDDGPNFGPELKIIIPAIAVVVLIVVAIVFVMFKKQ